MVNLERVAADYPFRRCKELTMQLEDLKERKNFVLGQIRAMEVQEVELRLELRKMEAKCKIW